MRRISLVFLLLIVILPVRGFAKEWQLDPVHSNFYFEIRHTFAAVRGQFTDFSADVFFDPDNPEKSKFDFVIRVDSIDTKIGKRDTHLRSPDFFDAGKYPVIAFKSSKITPVGENRYNVEGTLTIKDVSKDIALEFLYYGQKENPLKPGEWLRGLDSRLKLDRLEYHVGDGKFYKMGVVGNDVDILITLEMLQ